MSFKLRNRWLNSYKMLPKQVQLRHIIVLPKTGGNAYDCSYQEGIRKKEACLIEIFECFLCWSKIRVNLHRSIQIDPLPL